MIHVLKTLGKFVAELSDFLIDYAGEGHGMSLPTPKGLRDHRGDLGNPTPYITPSGKSVEIKVKSWGARVLCEALPKKCA